MNILVTGGAGFIGSHLAERYQRCGHRVLVLDNLSSGLRARVPDDAEFIEMDLLDFKAVERFCARENIDIISHHAAQVDVRDSIQNPLRDCMVNVNALIHLYRCARAGGLKQFIFASSGGVVYGEPATLPVPVTAAVEPMSPYGVSKVSAEYYLRCFFNLYRIPTTILRYANVYGPRQLSGEAGVVGIFFDRMLQGRPVDIYGDGEQQRDFVYIDDVVDANERVLGAGGCRTFNIGTGRPTAINALYRMIARLTQFSQPAVHRDPRRGELLKSALDISHTTAHLGWEPRVSLIDGLETTCEWWLEHAARQTGAVPN